MMFLFAEVAAAAVALAAAQQGQTAPAHRPVAASKPSAARHLAACKRAYPSYNARTDTYRNPRGKQVRCTK